MRRSATTKSKSIATGGRVLSKPFTFQAADVLPHGTYLCRVESGKPPQFLLISDALFQPDIDHRSQFEVAPGIHKVGIFPANVAGTRVPVWQVISYIKQGLADTDIAGPRGRLPNVSLKDIDNCRDYYAANPDDINDCLRPYFESHENQTQP